MKEETTSLNLGAQTIIDVDYSIGNHFIGVTNENNVVTPWDIFKINQAFKFPIIRRINNMFFLIADARVREKTDNCFIFDFKGKQLSKFFAGDGIQDIEVLNNRIIITYFDEGVFGMDGPNNEGLVVFDLTGKILFEYNSRHRENTIADCYCICPHSKKSILFFPYTEFPLIELNLETWKEKIYDIPEMLHGSNAVTSIGTNVIFHSPYDDKRGLFTWSIKDKAVTRIGKYSEGLRGLPGGRFLSKGEKGFTLIDLS